MYEHFLPLRGRCREAAEGVYSQVKIQARNFTILII
jgi:hypothetical protein